jgi:hypothetical protein
LMTSCSSVFTEKVGFHEYSQIRISILTKVC